MLYYVQSQVSNKEYTALKNCHMTSKSSSSATPLAVIHGRFQPLHLGHLEYILAGKRACQMLVIGITNPDPSQIGAEDADPERGRAEANPCTFYERYLMVEGAMVESGIDREQFRVVPFPHSYPERLLHYSPREALYLLTVYDRWGEVKLERFQRLGLRTHVLWRRDKKVTSGTEVRRRIRDRQPWEHLVPGATARTVREQRIDERIRSGRPSA
jgi:nicotinamide mononucleotide adenylyltransferase